MLIGENEFFVASDLRFRDPRFRTRRFRTPRFCTRRKETTRRRQLGPVLFRRPGTLGASVRYPIEAPAPHQASGLGQVNQFERGFVIKGTSNTSSTKKVKRNRRRADRGIEYDVSDGTQHREAGGNKRARAATPPASRPQIPRGTLGPSGLPMLRTSERGTFKRCRWLWWNEFVELRKPIVDTPPLMFGSMVHVAFHSYYKKGRRRGPRLAGLFEQVIEAEVERVAKATKMRPHEIREDWGERIELGIAMMSNYVETYGKDEEWEVLATELPFQIPVMHPVRLTPWFWYTGILDLLMLHRPTGLKEIWDHKTTKAIQTKYLVMNDQVTSYYSYGVEALINKKLLQPKERGELNGLRINFLRKAMPDDREFVIEEGRKYYLNKDGSISKKQPPDYFKRHLLRRHSFEKERTRQRVVAEMADMEAVRREPDAGAYKNPTQWTCPSCWLLDVCELHEVGADWQSARDQTTRIWDPYEAHEVYFGETR